MKHQFFDYQHDEIADIRAFIRQNIQNIDVVIPRLLFALGFRSNLYGVIYLREAIAYCFTLPLFPKVSFCKDVYPAVARKLGTTASRVERDVRTALQRCYESGSMYKLNKICNSEAISSKYPPTTSEFVMQVVYWLKIELSAQALSC